MSTATARALAATAGKTRRWMLQRRVDPILDITSSYDLQAATRTPRHYCRPDLGRLEVGRRLEAEQLRILAVASHEVLMGPLLDHMTVVEDDDAIGGADA